MKKSYCYQKEQRGQNLSGSKVLLKNASSQMKMSRPTVSSEKIVIMCCYGTQRKQHLLKYLDFLYK